MAVGGTKTLFSVRFPIGNISLCALLVFRLVTGRLSIDYSASRHGRADSSKGPQLVVLLLILLALRPPFFSSSGTPRQGFVHPTLVPFPDTSYNKVWMLSPMSLTRGMLASFIHFSSVLPYG